MSFDVSCDKPRQLIRLRIEGNLIGTEAETLSAAIGTASRELDVQSRVRILMDGSRAGKMDTRARRTLMVDLKRGNLHRLAIWGVPGYIRLFMNTWFKAFGAKKILFFDTEAAALRWLEE